MLLRILLRILQTLYFVKKKKKNYYGDNHSNVSFTDTHIPKNKEWFDDEFLTAKTSCMDALHDFNIHKSESTRLKLFTKKKEYKTLLKKKRKQYDNKLINKIENLRFSKSKQFWRFFKTRKKSLSGNDLQIGDFKNYFSELCNDIFTVKNDLAEYFCENHEFHECTDYSFSDLDRPISLDELYNGV